MHSTALNPAAMLFKRRYGHPPAHLVRAPGALTLLGGLAHLAEGLSLAVAVDRHVSLAAAPRTDGQIELIHPLDVQGHKFWLTHPEVSSGCVWATPAKNTLAALRARGVHFSGFNAAIHEGIPPGLGAQSALEIATTLLVRKMFPFSLTDTGLGPSPKRHPRTQQLPEPADAERRCLANLLGSSPAMDRFTPLFAKPWQALVIDWQSGQVERWPLGGTAVVFCDADESTPVEDRIFDPSQSLVSAARKLGVRSLRSVEPALLKSNEARLEANESALVAHQVSENHWIVRCESALRDGDHRQIGQFLSLSHDQARDELKAVQPEAEALVQAARAHPACLGSRAMFESGRSATVSLVNYHEVDGFLTHLTGAVERRLGRDVQPLVLPIVEGAG
jgi:galactokinase